MSYVRLKHTLAEIALDAVAHPGPAPTAALLLAYAKMSRRRPSVPLAALARAAGVAHADGARALSGEGPCGGPDGAGGKRLCAALRPVAPDLSTVAARL